jgi:methyl coenzyme M reductase subunit D
MQNTNSKSSLYVVGAVLAVAVLGWLIYSLGGVSRVSVSGNNTPVKTTPTTNTNVVAPDKATVKNNKAEILSLVEQKRVLTKEERTKVLTALNGSLIDFYGFTESEKKEIIDALNRK